ncbi:hypothetical protein M409DRAFT_17898 [Zasmidium cellare ATCC 36951]|uniref:Uncharacterized protein n=1 Tax=Zasmidium cellare ATCC 36951 TaxID=1080233 RepID=A0A6A6CX14_ZASCE|nr:uncharacterized protein M409DRAFT_17898 [Zasmidium cellare ATCC 36951]KAF2171661.1 hypothetical protein M409DRAFT_17898 [Zasmidium cellare ATCC 36951]
MHDSLPPLSQDALNLLFHSVPILIDPGYSTGSSAYIFKFFRCHDSKCGFAQRHRVRLKFPLPRTTTRCTHLRCILRALRCQSSFASPERSKASWGWIATGNCIPLENLEILPGQEPLIDFERLSALRDVALLFFWLGASTVSVFCFRIILPLYNVYVLPWKDRLDGLHAYTQQQKRSHGWLGFTKVHLRCATLVFSALLAVASFFLHTYCDDEALREEVDTYVGVMCVTVGIVGYLVWKPNR